jgi:hypothetical protein
MVIGPLRSYQDVYVAACGDQFVSHQLGIQHERECQACRIAIEAINQQREPRAESED